MAVSMNDVKTLRNKTSAGFLDCKKALENANGNMAEAEKLLKEMGLAAAAKRQGRVTSEGSIFTAEKRNKAAILELSCETDFVARNITFQELGTELLQMVLSNETSNITDTMKSKLQDTIATIKENMEIKRVEILHKSDNEIFAHYTHGVPARLGSVIVVGADNTNVLQSDTVKKFAHNCALHAVARLPLFLNENTIDEAYKQEQIEIFTTQTQQLGKPENIAQGIVQGKWKKHQNEICFTLQPWVHDEKTTSTKISKLVSDEVGATVSINKFILFLLSAE